MRRMRHAGTTLIELLISLSIIVLISGAVFAVYLESMGFWRRVSSEEQAMPAAYQVSTRLAQELKNGFNVSVTPDGKSLTFQQPQTDGNGYDLLPLTPARAVTYYLSDATGAANTPGTVLWRSQTDLTTNAVTRMKLASNVSGLQFTTVAASYGRVFAVYTTAVTFTGQEGIVKNTSQFTTTAAIRCPMVAP